MEYLEFDLAQLAVVCAAIGLWVGVVGLAALLIALLRAALGLWRLVGPWLARVILVVVGPAVLLIAGILRAALGLCRPWLLLVIVGVIGLAVLPLTGHGATVYVVDTGIAYHKTLPNVKHAFGLPGDCHGHGTHVAGIIAHHNPGARIVDINVYDCREYLSYRVMRDGLKWINRHGAPGDIVNISQQMPDSGETQSIRHELELMVANGLIVVAAAGNDGVYACDMLPRSIPGVRVVGATGADWSNYGECVTDLAPGTRISSASWIDPAGYVTKSGTSMAAPAVAGVLSYGW